MRHKIYIFAALLSFSFSLSSACAQIDPVLEETTPLRLGIERTEVYLPLLKGKQVGLVVNNTSQIGNTHLLDTLLARGITVGAVFAPEHGFRGTADAGAPIKSYVDDKTGVPIVSLYGDNKKPKPAQIKDLDILVFDIQDVGARFYTYISTLHYVMEAAAEHGKLVLVLDRPNPNGHYFDGPVLEKSYTSFVGMHPIPVVHGMTIAEYAQMINGEGWLAGGKKCQLEVVAMEGYDHLTVYAPPVKPSPNLPNLRSIYLYPSLCFFEGTPFSVGRGTNHPFQLWGHPDVNMKDTSFTPISKPGAMNPPLLNKKSYGKAYTQESMDELRAMRFSLQPLLRAYAAYKGNTPFFNSFFVKLAGTAQLEQQIKAGLSEDEIRMTWEDDLVRFKTTRAKYLIYPDFE
jgi:uncharacterized protein YbbC (DUF1343 family)